MNTKILLTAILKDDTEYQMAKRMFASFMPYCQGLAVAITGLSKTTKLEKLIRKYNGVYVKTTPETHPRIYSNGKFTNFAEARNVSFQLADQQEGYDWYLWADVDDILIGGNELSQVATLADKAKMDMVFFTYWYAINMKENNTFDENDVQIDHTRERLIKPHMFKWVSRLHEVALPIDGNYKPRITEYLYDPKNNQNIVWAHITDEKRVADNMERNIEILEAQIKEEEHKDPRTVFYLAKTYYDMKDKTRDELALFLLDEYLRGPHPSGWPEERANAWEYIANICARRGDHKRAIKALHEGIQEFPNKHMLYLLLAKEYAVIGLYEHSDFFLDVVLRMDPPKARTTIGNPLEVKFMAASLKYNQAIRSQKIEEAIQWLKVRNELGHLKDDGMLQTLQDAKALNDAAHNVFNYAKWLKDNGFTHKIQKLLESLPPELGREYFAHYIANEINEPKVWPKKSIVYYASWGADHFEGWSPKNLEKGIGGSETAVIELAKRFAKEGYDVTVYGDPREDEGDYEGVHYRPWYEINWKDTFDTLILWRSPHLLDKDIKANRIFMDLHDVASQVEWTSERMDKVDKVFFKSKFHRSMLPKLPDEKAVIISNGIQI